MEGNGKWAITFGDTTKIIAQGENIRNMMQFNSGNNIFACYGSATQKPVFLYVRDNETDYEFVTDVAGYGEGNNHWQLISSPLAEVDPQTFELGEEHDLYAFDPAGNGEELEWRNFKAKLDGQELVGADESVMKTVRGNKVSIIFQDPMTSLNPTYTIGHQLMEAIMLHTDRTKAQARERAIEMLRLVNVNEPEKRIKQYPFEFSGGMRQRVMIAMALACEPDILIADEPTTALDVTIQAQILELMKSLQEELGMAIIMITHDLGVVAQMCDEVIVMYAGSICEQGTAEEIFYNPKHEYTKGLMRSIPTADTAGSKLQPITGTPIDLLNMPEGCPFAPRCNNAMKICLRQRCERMRINDEHFAACWMNVKEAIENGTIVPDGKGGEDA